MDRLEEIEKHYQEKESKTEGWFSLSRSDHSKIREQKKNFIATKSQITPTVDNGDQRNPEKPQKQKIVHKNPVDVPERAVITESKVSREKQLETVIDTLLHDIEELKADKADLTKPNLSYESIQPTNELRPTLIQLCYFYKKAVVEVTWRDGVTAVCQDWWMTGSMFWSFGDGNDRDFDIELELDPIDKLCFDGKMVFRLINPSEMSESMKAEYFALCKRLRFGQKTVRVDTPSSLLWLFNNNVDAFNLLECGLAKAHGSIP